MTNTVARWAWLGCVGTLTSACALAGYDFGEYERKATGGVESRSGSEGGSSAAGGEGGAGALALEPRGPAVSAFEAGGQPNACEPTGWECLEHGLECGPAPAPLTNACGQLLDCGGCFWWFQECRQNRCELVE